jgi:2-polyprenyl-3-methyl-5-hydroxy-6-metoxy-1,4-benzoquinol methylase
MSQDYFEHVRSDIKPLLPSTASRVLDIGCGAGSTSAWLKTIYPNALTIGLEGNATLLAVLEKNVDEARIVDLNHPLPDVGNPDLVLLLDVLEHLVHPDQLLAQVVDLMADDATIIVSLPNIAHISVAARLFFMGRFDYREAGILDGTHLRFFYRDSIFSLIEGAGLELISLSRPGLEQLDSPRRWRLLNRLTLGLLQDRFTQQFVLSAKRRPPAAANRAS